MFKRGWLRRNRIYSDEGFTVDVGGRFAVIYREGSRKMSIAAEMLIDGFALNVRSVGHWDDDLLHRVDDETKRRIIASVKRALESQGERVDLVW